MTNDQTEIPTAAETIEQPQAVAAAPEPTEPTEPGPEPRPFTVVASVAHYVSAPDEVTALAWVKEKALGDAIVLNVQVERGIRQFN